MEENDIKRLIEQGARAEKSDQFRQEERKQVLHDILMSFIRSGAVMVSWTVRAVFFSLIACFLVYVFHIISPWGWLHEDQLKRIEFIALSIIVTFVVNVTSEISFSILGRINNKE